MTKRTRIKRQTFRMLTLGNLLNIPFRRLRPWTGEGVREPTLDPNLGMMQMGISE